MIAALYQISGGKQPLTILGEKPSHFNYAVGGGFKPVIPALPENWFFPLLILKLKN